jgi:hypothetical protein
MNWSWEPFASRRVTDVPDTDPPERGTDLGQLGKLSSVMAKIARDASDRRRRLWRMKIPALAMTVGGAATLWMLALRDMIPEDQRITADFLALFSTMIVLNLLELVPRWYLDLRVAQARQKISAPPYIAHDGNEIVFHPAHVLTLDGIMVGALDPDRRLVRVIAPVFLGFDVIFPVDAPLHSARLTEPKLLHLPAVASLPGVSSDVQVASTFLIFVYGIADPARFTIEDADRPAAEKWMEAFAAWIRADAAA